MEHPRGYIRLGVNRDTGQPVDVSLDNLMRGCAVVGVTGSAKSTALRQIAAGAMASGAAVVGLDGKGPALKADLRMAANRHQASFYLLDPTDEATCTYDLLQGTPARISNKILGALIPSSTGDSAIYKQLAQGALPHIVEGLQRMNRSTATELQRVLSEPTLLAKLARESGDDELRDLAAQAGKDRLLVSALSGLSGRLRAVSAGYYRPMFDGPGPAYSWAITDEPSCTYLSLPTLDAVTDSAVIARVVLSDLAQAIARRQVALQGGATLRPLVVILDELTALSQADPEIEPRVLALLLQARAAHCAVVVAGQTLPVNPTARQAILGAGCLLTLRLTASDAETMAGELGTQPTVSVTHQVEWGQPTGQGTMTLGGHAYRINPQELRALAVGEGVLHIPPGQPIRVKIAQDSTLIPSVLRRWLRRPTGHRGDNGRWNYGAGRGN
jgi:hypothetical protein